MRTARAAMTLWLIMLTFHLRAQNVGIGETTPLARLEVKGSTESSSKSFFVKDGFNIPLLSVTNLAHVGINTGEPEAPLHIFSWSLGETVRIQAPAPSINFATADGSHKASLAVLGTSGLVLGTAAGTNLPVTITPNFNDAATFTPGGYTGLGVSDPAFRLDVNGRMRLRHSGESAGIWLNNAANTASNAFVGLQSDNLVGFYGSPAGWGLLMNTTNGNVGINTALPSARLEVQGDGSSSTAFKIGGGKFVYSGAGVNTQTPVFVHKATTSNTPAGLGYTVIDNPYCNSNSNAILIVTLNGTYGAGSGPGYDAVPEILNPDPSGQQIISPVSFLIFFNGPSSGFYPGSPDYAKEKWCIKTYAGGNVTEPLNFNFNVMIVHPN